MRGPWAAVRKPPTFIPAAATRAPICAQILGDAVDDHAGSLTNPRCWQAAIAEGGLVF